MTNPVTPAEEKTTHICHSSVGASDYLRPEHERLRVATRMDWHDRKFHLCERKGNIFLQTKMQNRANNSVWRLPSSDRIRRNWQNLSIRLSAGLDEQDKTETPATESRNRIISPVDHICWPNTVGQSFIQAKLKPDLSWGKTLWTRQFSVEGSGKNFSSEFFLPKPGSELLKWVNPLQSQWGRPVTWAFPLLARTEFYTQPHCLEESKGLYFGVWANSSPSRAWGRNHREVLPSGLLSSGFCSALLWIHTRPTCLRTLLPTVCFPWPLVNQQSIRTIKISHYTFWEQKHELHITYAVFWIKVPPHRPYIWLFSHYLKGLKELGGVALLCVIEGGCLGFTKSPSQV